MMCINHFMPLIFEKEKLIKSGTEFRSFALAAKVAKEAEQQKKKKQILGDIL